MTEEIVVVLTTFPPDKDVLAFARILVQERLAACVNVLPPMKSIYRWKDAIETADEQQVVIKTAANRVEELKTRLKSLHPYDLPEFVVIQAEGSPEYLSWIVEGTRP
jgi:periplasmic divalent cation tolerance protein